MTLYQLLEPFVYYQTIHIYRVNAFDQNIPVFHGTVQEAKQDGCTGEESVWDNLMCEVEVLEMHQNELIVKVKDPDYEKPCEEHYLENQVKKWDRRDPQTRPYRFSVEIEQDIAVWHIYKCRMEDLKNKSSGGD